MDSDQPLTPQEVADTLRIAKNTVYELIKRGELRGYRVGNKFRVDLKDVIAYKNGVRNPPETPVYNETNSSDLSQVYTGLVHPANIQLHKDKQEEQNSGFIICGQDILLDVLAQRIEVHPKGGRVYRSYLGSYNGLYALYQKDIHAATAHLWEGDTNTYNVPYMHYLLPGVPLIMVHLACRTVGFYVKAGNPKKIKTWNDFSRDDLVFANRERGSGMRVLLDEHLRISKLNSTGIKGYNREYPTHLAAASAVARNSADFALGNEKACRQVNNVEFVPLQKERYELVFHKDDLQKPIFQALMEIVQSKSFKEELQTLGSYDLTETGKLIIS